MVIDVIVLGIDPGTATTGYGVVEVVETKLQPIEFGLIETDKDGSAESRLAHIFLQMNMILKKFKPELLAIEKVFFATNAKTAIRVGQAQGVMLLSAASFNVPVFEYSPMTIKKLVSGNGRADKKSMQESIRKILGASVKSEKNKKTHFDNAADALAVAVCHIYTVNPACIITYSDLHAEI